MKKLLLFILALILIVGCKPGATGGAAKKIETEEDKIFYAVGNMFGGRLANLELSDNEIDALTVGLRDAAKGKKPVVEIVKYQSKVQEMFRNRMSKSKEKSSKAGDVFLKKFLAEPGVKQTASGLAYKIIKPGTGAVPKATDKVEVHYHGTLIDGTVFDSSKDRGKTVEFPLNRVIKGWTEGLQLVKQGGTIKLVIPSKLGYGDHGAPPKIPGGATLIFDVELIKVVPQAAAKKAPAKKAKKSKK